MLFAFFVLQSGIKYFSPEAFYFYKFHYLVICSRRDAILRGSMSPTHSKI